MGEVRSEGTNRLRHGLRFYARCAGEAWRRSWDAGNAWPPVFGLLLLSGGAWLAGVDLAYPGDTPYGASIGTGLFILIAWLTVFVVQFVAAPPRLYARLDAELQRLARQPALPSPVPLAALPVAALPVAALPAAVLPDAVPPVAALAAPALPVAVDDIEVPAPPAGPASAPAAARLPSPPAPRPALASIDVHLHDQLHETAATDTAGERLPASRAYRARVTNRGDTAVRRCQIFFCNPTHIQVVSAPFDLAPGAHRDLPVLRVIDEGDDPHALLYFLDAETWQVAEGQAAWLPEPGRFKVKVLSANAPATSLDVKLSRSAGTPFAWTLLEAGEPDRPRAGRKPSAWTAADAVAEPNAAD